MANKFMRCSFIGGAEDLDVLGSRNAGSIQLYAARLTSRHRRSVTSMVMASMMMMLGPVVMMLRYRVDGGWKNLMVAMAPLMMVLGLMMVMLHLHQWTLCGHRRRCKRGRLAGWYGEAESEARTEQSSPHKPSRHVFFSSEIADA